MYYSAFDEQCNRFFATGRNESSKRVCMEDIYSYLISQSDSYEEMLDDMKKFSDEKLESEIWGWEVEIITHKNKIVYYDETGFDDDIINECWNCEQFFDYYNKDNWLPKEEGQKQYFKCDICGKINH